MNWNDLNTSYPARIVEFYPETQTADIQIAIESYVNTPEAMYHPQELAIVYGAPVHFPQCNHYAITFPIKVGDDCLAVFTQRGYDHWLYENKMEAGLNAAGKPTASHMRGYSKTDAIVFVGINPNQKAISNFSPDNLEIRSKDMTQFVSLRPDGTMEVTTPSALTVNAMTVTINASKTTVNGAFEVNGNSTFNGNTNTSGTAIMGQSRTNGINFSTHTHTTIALGAETSKPN